MAEHESDVKPARLAAEFSPEQLAFLAQFATNYLMGRRMLCAIAHLIAVFGAAGGAIAGLYTLVDKMHVTAPVLHP